MVVVARVPAKVVVVCSHNGPDNVSILITHDHNTILNVCEIKGLPFEHPTLFYAEDPQRAWDSGHRLE